MRQPVLVAGSLTLAVILVGVAFFATTTFIGDDHLFLAFARYVPNPLVAFFRDQHGGEYYRPLPMLVWWLLARVAPGSTYPFAALAFALHLVVSIQLVALLRAVRCHVSEAGAAKRRVPLVAGALFFLSPLTQEAAFWYAASTDLFATALALGTVLALLRGSGIVGALFFAAACWSKEWAVIVPLLAALAIFAQAPRTGLAGLVKRVAPLLPVAAIYLIVRTAVLGGAGRSGDQSAPFLGKALQIASGLCRLVTGSVIASDALTYFIGVAVWALLLVGAARSRRAAGEPRLAEIPGSAPVLAPLLWIAFSLIPLLGASWIVGARYFYLPAIGVAWLAAQLLAGVPTPVLVAVTAALAGLSTGQGLARRDDIVAYDARLAAARRAVADGLAHGFDTFHVAAGIKDLDLAVKQDGRFSNVESRLVVLGDVPASFLALPEPRAAQLEFLLARPPLPPSGAYQFGARRIVGMARRGDDPTLDEVTTRLPGVRFIRLRLGPGGRIIARDVTHTSPDGSK